MLNQSDHPLSARRILAAYYYGMALTVLVSAPVGFALKLLFVSLTRGLPLKAARPLDLLALAVFWFGLGLFLAFNQLRILRHWVQRRSGWLIASGAAMMLIAPGCLFLMQRLAFLPPNALNFFSLLEPQARQLEAAAAAWGWAGGAACGLAGGLLFGLIQSGFLPAHRRLWWLLNGAVWPFLTGAVLSLMNINNLISAWGPWAD